MPVIQVYLKSVYGRITVYPANEAAQTLANIAGTKTLATQTLKYAEQLGMVIETVEAITLAEVMA